MTQESQYIYKDHINKLGKLEKARLVFIGDNYYVGEFKDETMKEWFPTIVGTAEWLSLSEQDKQRAINKCKK